MAHTAGSERVRDGTKINKSWDLPRSSGERGGSAGVIGPAVSPRGTQIPGLTHHAPPGRVVGPPIWGFSAVERLVRIPSYAAFLNLGFSHLRPKFQVTQIHYKKPSLALYSTLFETTLESGIQRGNYGKFCSIFRYRGMLYMPW